MINFNDIYAYLKNFRGLVIRGRLVEFAEITIVDEIKDPERKIFGFIRLYLKEREIDRKLRLKDAMKGCMGTELEYMFLNYEEFEKIILEKKTDLDWIFDDER